MFKYTPLCVSRWMVMGPRLWVWLLLVVSVVMVAGFATDGPVATWWVWPDERCVGGGVWCASRVGCWVWRLLGVMQASQACLVCRVGLLAGLIVGSGLAAHSPYAWHWLWLPMGDWALGVLGCVCPRLAVRPTYQDLRAGLHRAYQWSVLGLGLLMVQRGLHVDGSGVALGSLVVCEREGSRVELEAVPGPEGRTTYRARLSGEFVLEVTPRDEFEKRLFIVRKSGRNPRLSGEQFSTPQWRYTW